MRQSRPEKEAVLLEYLPLNVLLREAAMPLALLNLMIVALYIIFVRFTWKGMSWREAILWAPLAVPLTFFLFFAGLVIAAQGAPFARFAVPLAIVLAVAWLPGIGSGAVTWWAINRRRH